MEELIHLMPATKYAPSSAAGNTKMKLAIWNQRGIKGEKSATAIPIKTSTTPYKPLLNILDVGPLRAVTYPPPHTAAKPKMSDHAYKAGFVEPIPTRNKTTEAMTVSPRSVSTPKKIAFGWNFIFLQRPIQQ